MNLIGVMKITGLKLHIYRTIGTKWTYKMIKTSITILIVTGNISLNNKVSDDVSIHE